MSNEIKPFHRQICECNDLGFRKKKKFFSFEKHPDLLPAFPHRSKLKKFVEAIKSGECKGVDLIVCDRFKDKSNHKFKGICSSGHPECRKLRGF